MKLTTLPNGSTVCDDDPGEPSTGAKRISVTEDEAELLAWLARDKTVLEIGTGLGVSTQAMARTACHVDTIDSDPWVWMNSFLNMRPIPSLHCWRSRDEMTARNHDMVFIDGEHTTDALKTDLSFAKECCTRGIIVVHDWKIDAVKLALDDSYAYIDTHHGLALKVVGWD